VRCVKVYTVIDDPRMPLREVAAYAQRAERLGFAGLLVPEAVHDGFLTALLAIEHTRTLEVATAVVVAFARSPTAVAYAAWDLQSLSGGRFVLGLGTQVKANIVGRFGVDWQPPAARMRDYIGALRAVWASWQDGTALRFESTHYRLDRMQPFFNPGPIEHPRIPIFVGGVNRRMMRLAGEVGDGVMTHPTNTGPRYLRERVLPEMRQGAARAGRSGDGPRVIASTFVATGPSAAAVERERARLREYMGFLYSTPQYWPTLELYGWSDIGVRLRGLTREGRWTDMKDVITDAVFDQLVPAGTYDEIAPLLAEWYGGLVSGLTLRLPDDTADDAGLARLVTDLQGR
jgi:probable F420-dependent oxidoreductase